MTEPYRNDKNIIDDERETLDRINGNYIWSEIRSVLNLDKGIFYTIKEIFIQPGATIHEFLWYDRKRIVKPIIFIIITSLIYSLIAQFFHIEDQYINQKGLDESTVGQLIQWVQGNYGYANILMGIFIALFVKLFFRNYDYNFYEILIMLCFVMGMSMIIFSVLSLIQGLFHIELFQIGGILAFVYTTYAIADFFDKKLWLNYVKSLAAYILGMLLFFIALVIIGVGIDFIFK